MNTCPYSKQYIDKVVRMQDTTNLRAAFLFPLDQS